MTQETIGVRTSVVLACTQFLYLSASSVGMAFSGLVGATLATNRALATLPLSMITIATAITTLFASRFMTRFGRVSGFVLGSVFGIIGGLLSTAAILHSTFTLFCLGAAMLGVYQAFAQHYRYAAADNASGSFKSKAISYVLLGGLVAAFLGPMIAKQMQGAIETHAFAGSYIGVAILATLSIPLLMSLRIDRKEKQSSTASESRPVAELLMEGETRRGIASCAAGYGVMMFVMTATPLAFVGCGFSSVGAASLIQWHLVAMFAPSLVSGKLVARFSASRIALLGILLQLAGSLAAAAGTTPAFFYAALVLSGIGWNFMYVGGTLMLTHGRNPVERAKVQGLNEFIVFGVVALCSAMAGWVYQTFGWETLNHIGIGALIVFIVHYLRITSPLPRPASEQTAATQRFWD